MIQVIREIIADFQRKELDIGAMRDIDIIPVKNKAAICIGVRRSGKSTYMFQIMAQLLDQGVNPKNMLYINFFDDRLQGLKHQPLDIIWEAFCSIYPERNADENVYVFFDEIQMIPNWEPFVDRLMRMENCTVYITGSSAQMLSREMATQMRGRSLSWELFPFSFPEYLNYHDISYLDPISSKMRRLIQNQCDAYWRTGGFPEVAALPSDIRVKVHQEYFNTMLFRDIIERHDIAHPKAIKDLAYRLINNIASMHSINALTGYLKSLGHRVSKSLVGNYLEWFEDAFMLFIVRKFDASQTRSNSNPKKVYCIDHAFVTSISSGILVNSGHLLENLVYITLRRITPSIFYFKSATGREVDFIIQRRKHEHQLIQVCESLVDPVTKKREISALTDAMHELNLKKGIIVTRNEMDTLMLDQGMISIVPIWQFLLYHDDLL